MYDHMLPQNRIKRTPDLVPSLALQPNHSLSPRPVSHDGTPEFQGPAGSLVAPANGIQVLGLTLSGWLCLDPVLPSRPWLPDGLTPSEWACYEKYTKETASSGRCLKFRKHCPGVKCCSYLWSSKNAADFDTCLSESLIRKEIHCHENHMSPPQAKWNRLLPGSRWWNMQSCLPVWQRWPQRPGFATCSPSSWSQSMKVAWRLQAAKEEGRSSWAWVRRRGLGSAEAAKCPAQLPPPRAGAPCRASPSPPGWQAPFHSCEAAWTPPAISSLLSLPSSDRLLLCLSACVFSLSFILFLFSFFVSPCVFVSVST